MSREGGLQHSFDSLDESLEHVAERLGFARAESMDLVNDPRFASGNIINKRLAAFKGLSMVSGLMLGTSIGQCFALDKGMDFSRYDPELFGGFPILGCIGWWQIAGFTIQVAVVFMSMMATYVICHQLFYTYRLLTAGPTGFEQASMFYLNKTVCMWRHLAIKCLLNGLWLFLAGSGTTLFVKFYLDARGTDQHYEKVIVENPVDGNVTTVEGPEEGVDMFVHVMLAYGVLALFISFAVLLFVVRRQHLGAFRECYTSAKAASVPLIDAARNMQTRSHRAMLAVGNDYYLDT